MNISKDLSQTMGFLK